MAKRPDFKCFFCGGTFTPDDEWTKEDATTELQANFGVERDVDDMVACDDCYTVLMKGRGDAAMLAAHAVAENNVGVRFVTDAAAFWM